MVIRGSAPGRRPARPLLRTIASPDGAADLESGRRAASLPRSFRCEPARLVPDFRVTRSSAEDLRAIGEALHAVAASDLRLVDEVTKARANGRTWTQIAAVLGVSRQAARERFGGPARR